MGLLGVVRIRGGWGFGRGFLRIESVVSKPTMARRVPMVHVLEDRGGVSEGKSAIGACGGHDRLGGTRAELRAEFHGNFLAPSSFNHHLNVVAIRRTGRSHPSYPSHERSTPGNISSTYFPPNLLTFPQLRDIVGDPQPPAEARQALLKDVRAARDVIAQNRFRVENQLLAAQQLVNVLASQLRIHDERLASIEDLIGEVRARMHTRGLMTHFVVRRPPPRSPNAVIPASPRTCFRSLWDHADTMQAARRLRPAV